MARDDPPFLYSAVPTVEVDGMSYPLVSRNMEKMRVSEALGGLTTLELTLTDAVSLPGGEVTHAADSGSPLQLGAGIRVFAGPAAVEASEIFDGQITAIEAEVCQRGSPLLTVLAEDRLFSARRKRRTRLIEQSSPADVASLIAEDHGLRPEIRDGLDHPIADWMQSNETDLAFLRRILKRFDADVQIVSDRLQVGAIGNDQRVLVTLAAGATLKNARITADVAHQLTATTLASFDPETGEPVTAEGTNNGSGPGSGQSGADILEEKFAEVSEHLGRYGPMSQEEADILAQVEFDRRARAFVCATGTAQGNPQIRIGTWLALVAVNPQFENEYAVTNAVHRWDRDNGYLTDFSAECAYLGEGQ